MGPLGPLMALQLSFLVFLRMECAGAENLQHRLHARDIEGVDIYPSENIRPKGPQGSLRALKALKGVSIGPNRAHRGPIGELSIN